LEDKKLGAVAGYEDSRVHRYPKTAELRPADDVLKWQTSGSLVHHGGEVGWRPCRGNEQSGLIFGENTTGGPKPVDDV
jgi:hypothetical protein